MWMDAMATIWETQPSMLVMIVLLVVAIAFSRIGGRLLGSWLGLTNKNAARMSGVISFGLWAALFLLVIGFRIGSVSLSGLSTEFGGLVGGSWWIMLLIAGLLVWKRLR